MTPDDRLLEMLSGNIWRERIIALDQIYTAGKASPEVLKAVEKATEDPDPQVAQKARWVLRSLISPRPTGEGQIAHPPGIERSQTNPTDQANNIYAERQRYYGVEANRPFPLTHVPTTSMQESKNSTAYPWNATSVLRLIFSLVIGSAIFILGVGLAWAGYQQQQTINASHAWPVSPGAVVATRIELHRNKESGPDYTPFVTYQYAVNGNMYSCSFSLDEADSNEEAAASLGNFPQGFQVRVSYNPQQPEVCVTQYDPPGSPLPGIGCAAMGLAQAAVGILMIVSPKVRKFLDKNRSNRG